MYKYKRALKDVVYERVYDKSPARLWLCFEPCTAGEVQMTHSFGDWYQELQMCSLLGVQCPQSQTANHKYKRLGTNIQLWTGESSVLHIGWQRPFAWTEILARDYYYRQWEGREDASSGAKRRVHQQRGSSVASDREARVGARGQGSDAAARTGWGIHGGNSVTQYISTRQESVNGF